MCDAYGSCRDPKKEIGMVQGPIMPAWYLTQPCPAPGWNQLGGRGNIRRSSHSCAVLEWSPIPPRINADRKSVV